MGIGGVRMQDRFKFRVWKANEKRMVEGVTYLNPLMLDEDIAPEEAKNNILMQCTGLKDKNGKLIYELDYVRYANNKYEVRIDKFLGISLTNILNGDTIVMDDIVLFNCEVIGNEFESNTKI